MRLYLGYIPQTSWLHHLHPIAQFELLTAGTIAVFIFPSLLWLVLSIIIMLLLAQSAGCLHYWLPALCLASIPAWFIAFINMAWADSVIPSGHIPSVLSLTWLYEIIAPERATEHLYKGRILLWNVTITTHSLEKGLFFAARWVSVVGLGLLFLFVTKPELFASALSTQLRVPFLITFMLATGFAYIPVLMRDARLVYDAQRSRGARIDCGFFPLRLVRMFPLLFPVLVTMLQHASARAIGMEVRGFHVGRNRTVYHHLPLRRTDVVALVAGPVVVGLAAVARVMS